MICSDCGHEMHISTGALFLNVRNEEVPVSGIEHFACAACGNWSALGRKSDELVAAANAQYIKNHGMMNPSEIKELRRKYKLSQNDLAELLGAGKTVVSRWETGTVLQPNIADRFLHIIAAHPEIVDEYLQSKSLPTLSVVSSKKAATRRSALA